MSSLACERGHGGEKSFPVARKFCRHGTPLEFRWRAFRKRLRGKCRALVGPNSPDATRNPINAALQPRAAKRHLQNGRSPRWQRHTVPAHVSRLDTDHLLVFFVAEVRHLLRFPNTRIPNHG